jgi:outer membrane protein OmpA-like peptidoglycan-associated protein
MITKLLSTTLFILCFTFINGFAQIDVKGKIKDKSVERADQRTDEGIDEGIDAVEDGVKSIFKKKEKSANDEEKTEEQNENNNEENSGDEQVKPSTENKPAKQEEPKLTSSTKYDFVPGDQVILYEDFSQDAVGDFPALWTTSGSGEVRTLNLFPGNWLCMNAQDKVYCLMKDLTLPENFIFEFDLVPTPPEDNESIFSFYFTLYNSSESEFLTDDLYPSGLGGVHVTCHNGGWDITAYNDQAGESRSGNSTLAPIEINKSNHVVVWVQKQRLRIYHKGQKTVDLPTILYPGVKMNRLRFSNWSGQGTPYVTNVRFTTAKPDMRSKLLTEGKLISYGIYFDINSDKVKAESYGTLKEIAQVLTENPAVKIKIVGHTDGDGDAAKNLDLSKRRAASVKNELSKNFGIDVTRIETDGKGKSEPLAPNDTPANKAKNRRVEFIKL